jgi:hypothetical protein
MRRIKDYGRFIAWQTGVGYLLLWAVTFWTLDGGANVFGKSGVCVPDAAKVLFYWVCESSSPLSILASLANVALTATVWAPVYMAAATVDPGAIAIAAPIMLVHVVGLPLGIFVLVRLMAGVLDLRRRIPGRRGPGTTPSVQAASATPAAFAAAPAGVALAPPAAARSRLMRAAASPRPGAPPRDEFGLRCRDAGKPGGGQPKG